MQAKSAIVASTKQMLAFALLEVGMKNCEPKSSEMVICTTLEGGLLKSMYQNRKKWPLATR